MRAAAFLAIAFSLTWAVVLGAWQLGVRPGTALAVPVLSISMFGPAIAALICVGVFERGRRVEALGLRFSPNLWWAIAWLTPAAIAVLAVAISSVLTEREVVDPGLSAIAAAEAQRLPEADYLRGIPGLGAYLFIAAMTAGTLANTILLTFSEEIGWRGYLYDRWQRSGFWFTSLSTGMVWGLWHAPAVYLFGHHYPDQGFAGVGLLVLYCLLLSPLFTLIRERGRSVWAAGILHGSYNAVSPLAAAMLDHAPFPWNGMFGVGGLLVLTVYVAVIAVAGTGRH